MAERESNHQQFQKDNGIKRILLVDDEYDISSVMKLLLEENGFKVDSFTDACIGLTFIVFYWIYTNSIILYGYRKNREQ